MSDYFKYVEQYRVASTLLAENANIFWPRLQTRGLLVELALKTYICASGLIVEGHDLERVARIAVERGLRLKESDWSEIIFKINGFYFRHIELEAKYLSRYPTPDRPTLVSITPGHVALDEMIGRIVEQARTCLSRK